MHSATAKDSFMIGEFQVLRLIARGGTGVVYEALSPDYNEPVALKVLHHLSGASAKSLARFRRGAESAARLDHPNIVRMLGQGTAKHLHYYVMELVDGAPLSPDSLPSDHHDRYKSIAQLIAQAADALAYAHERSIIHRDIKPGNLLVTEDGIVKMADFGLAKVADDPGVTVHGELLGSLAYMSPEQVSAGNQSVDHRTDIYSLGATLYELLTSQHPFPAKQRREALRRIAVGDITLPRSIVPNVPKDLETICLKAMALRPRDRYQTAAEMADDLRRFETGQPVRTRRPSRIARMLERLGSRRQPSNG